jgi:hypothetical protein
MSVDTPPLSDPLSGVTAANTTPNPGKLAGDISSPKKAGFDRRTKLGRRAKSLFRALHERLGRPADALIVADCWSLAELKVLADRARSHLLEKEERTSHELGRIEFLIRHGEARLGLAPGSAEATPMSMKDKLASIGFAPPSDDDETDDDVEGD